jgi:hypothetical protein
MCEDFPCCGHEPGCCPDYDSAGRQLNMRCTCGAKVPLNSRSSLCPTCLAAPDEGEFECDEWDDEDGDDEPDDYTGGDYDGCDCQECDL